MTRIIANIRWIMIVSGVLTATMIYAAIATEAALQSTFGETLDGPLARIVVRNWGALDRASRGDADLRCLRSARAHTHLNRSGRQQSDLHRPGGLSRQPVPQPPSRPRGR